MACGCCSGATGRVQTRRCRRAEPAMPPAARSGRRGHPGVARSGGDRRYHRAPSGQLAAAPIAALCRLLSERAGDSGRRRLRQQKRRCAPAPRDPRPRRASTKADCLNRLYAAIATARRVPATALRWWCSTMPKTWSIRPRWACLMRPLLPERTSHSSRSSRLVQRHGGWWANLLGQPLLRGICRGPWQGDGGCATGWGLACRVRVWAAPPRARSTGTARRRRRADSLPFASDSLTEDFTNSASGIAAGAGRCRFVRARGRGRAADRHARDLSQTGSNMSYDRKAAGGAGHCLAGLGPGGLGRRGRSKAGCARGDRRGPLAALVLLIGYVHGADRTALERAGRAPGGGRAGAADPAAQGPAADKPAGLRLARE